MILARIFTSLLEIPLLLSKSLECLLESLYSVYSPTTTDTDTLNGKK